MSPRSFLLCTLAGLASISLLLGCLPVPKVPYNVTDPLEPNDDFDEATSVDLSTNSAEIVGLLTVADVDVYDLGPMGVGDKLTVDIEIPDRIPLNAVVALFDSVGRLFFFDGEFTHINSDPTADVRMPPFEPHFDFTVRQTTSRLYLAVASLAEQVDSDGDGILDDFQGFTGGPYAINLAVERGGPRPQPTPQVVALWFDDATVDYPPYSNFGQVTDPLPFQVSAFDSQVLDPAYWSQDPNFLAWFQFFTGTQQLPTGFPTTPDPAFADVAQFRSMLRNAMNELYAGKRLDVEFLISGLDPLPADGNFSTLYFTADANGMGLYGLASTIDILNKDHTDFATIWAGEIGFDNAFQLAMQLWAQENNIILDPPADPYYSTAGEAASLVAMIGVHELGHILGLNHTSDPLDIMAAGPVHNSFRELLMADWLDAPLHPSIFPLGRQDSFLMLFLTLGLK